MAVPVISFIGWSGAGKTTFIEKLIPVLRQKGLRLAVIKRDGHEFQVDREGKDTWRFTHAGAECVAIANDVHAAIMDQRKVTFKALLSRVGNVDLIIAEGWNEPGIPKIEVFRNRTELRCERREELIAVISDNTVPLDIPIFPLNAVTEVARFVLDYFSEKDACWLPYAQQVSGAKTADSEVKLSIGERDVVLLPFVQDILRSVNLGIISTLKDTDVFENDEITITIRSPGRKS